MKLDLEKRIKRYQKLKFKITNMGSDLEKAKKELIEMGCSSLIIRLEDLVNELARLEKLDVSYLEVRVDTGISYYGKHDTFEMASMVTNGTGEVKSDDQMLYIRIYDKGLNSVDGNICHYGLNIPFDFNDIQADGKPMYEHMGVRVEKEYPLHRVYTKYVVDKNVGNLILDLPMKFLGLNYDGSISLWTLALINCAKKSLNSRNEHVRSRTRKK